MITSLPDGRKIGLADEMVAVEGRPELCFKVSLLRAEPGNPERVLARFYTEAGRGMAYLFINNLENGRITLGKTL